MARTARITSFALALPALVACGGTRNPSVSFGLGTQSGELEAETAVGADPKDRPVLAEAAAVDALPAPLSFTPRKGWKVERPTSAMRVAQFTLPRVERDAADAELVVYHFPGGGGGVDANFERWQSQMSGPEADGATTSTFDRAGLVFHTLDVSGTYVAETSPGSNERVNKPGWRMLATVVECEGGPYYVKCVGPAATVERWESSYLEFLTSMR